jgi:hypothetical protein
MNSLTRSAVLTAALFLAAAPAVAHAQGSIGVGILPSGGSVVQSASADALWEANRFNKTYTAEQITECWKAVEAAGGISTGIRPCPTQPITSLDLFAGNLLFGSVG